LGSSGRRPGSQIKIGSPQGFPQYLEVPPNIEVKPIVSGSSPLLSYSSNPLLSKDDSKLLNFPVVGNPFAFTTSMILVIIRMKVLAEKRKELSQTIASLVGVIRTEKGCRRCDFFQSMEEENDLCLLEEWDTRGNLNSHLKSRHFRVLRGAMNLLQEPYEFMFHTVAAEKRKAEARSQPAVS